MVVQWSLPLSFLSENSKSSTHPLQCCNNLLSIKRAVNTEKRLLSVCSRLRESKLCCLCGYKNVGYCPGIDMNTFIAGLCDVASGAGSVNALPGGGATRLAPSFDASTPRNVTALVGKSAYLSCRVRNLGNRTSLDPWVRTGNRNRARQKSCDVSVAAGPTWSNCAR
ncbi:hypothetical protein ACJJTC_005366 [Scirpophaga incertulas]